MVWVGDRWRLYVITSTSPFNTLSYYESSEVLPGPYDWSERIDCAIAPEPLPDRGWWHVDVQLHDGE